MRYKNTDALPIKEQGEEKRCGECFHFPVCKPHTEPNETFPEVGGCTCFKRTADAVEVVHAKWIKHKENCLEYRCSVCEYELCRKTNYCPQCGAKMGDERREK